MKRAIMIDPKTKSILAYKIDGSVESIAAAVGGDFELGAALDTGEMLYVDETGMCKKDIHYFVIGAQRLLAGRALLVGPEGRSGRITDVRSTIEEIEQLVRFVA